MNKLTKTVFSKILLFDPNIEKTTLIILITKRVLRDKQDYNIKISYTSNKEPLLTNFKEVKKQNSNKLCEKNVVLVNIKDSNIIEIDKSIFRTDQPINKTPNIINRNIIFKSISLKDKNGNSHNKEKLENNHSNKKFNCEDRKFSNSITSSTFKSIQNNKSETNIEFDSSQQLSDKTLLKNNNKFSIKTNSKNSDLIFFKIPDINIINNLITPNMSNMTAYQNIISTNFNSNISLFNDNKSTNPPKTINNIQASKNENLVNANNNTTSTNNITKNGENTNKSSNSSYDDIQIEDFKSNNKENKQEEEKNNAENRELNNNTNQSNINFLNINENYFNNKIFNNNFSNNVYSNLPTENINNNYETINMNQSFTLNEELYKQIQNYNNSQHQMGLIHQGQQKAFLDNSYPYIQNNKDIENNLNSIHGYSPLALGGFPYAGLNIGSFPGYNNLNGYNVMNYNLGQLKGMTINQLNNMPQINSLNLPMNGYNGGYNLINQNLAFRNNYYEKEKLQDEVSIPKKYLYRDNYLDLLLESYDSLKNKDSLQKAIEDYQKEQHQEEELKKQSQNDSFCNNALDTEYLKNGRFLRKCENKICTVSERKKGSCKWHKVKIHNTKKSITICSLCYKAYRNKQYCYYCGQIYKDTYCNQDTKMWIECCECKGWHHVSCEEQSGYYKDIANLAKEDTFEYVCFTCRESKDFKDRKRKVGISSNNLLNKTEVKGASALNSQEQKLLGRKIKSKAGVSNFPEVINNRMISRNTKKSNAESLPLSKHFYTYIYKKILMEEM